MENNNNYFNNASTGVKIKRMGQQQRKKVNPNQRTSQNRNNEAKENTQRNTIEIIGDCILKEIKGFKMSEATGERVFIKSFSGATTDCMNSHAVPTIKRNPKAVILHCYST